MGIKSVVMTLCIAGMIGLAFLQNGGGVSAAGQPGKNDDAGPLELTVILERVYLDGEVSEERVEEKVWALSDFWARYEGWELISLEDNQVVFKQHVDDISPLLKANGYFGLSGDGVLTIFNGRPDESNIIQSFFQIDVGKLESRKRQELRNGIPIRSKDEYEKVLETFKSYTRDEKQKK
ncbi:intercompartmental signaling factor BofC [Bacillus sp. FJAT-27251]|uniref:intercompartmental signaling factor BofC n=1 Tax=Bacillus sp. FJAT-27251 TaxID=1684142 RepID=UPI0006A7AA11|nr:intercompartmental signaling factor BofC [Bacillus sp. FJAT-27251]